MLDDTFEWIVGVPYKWVRGDYPGAVKRQFVYGEQSNTNWTTHDLSHPFAPPGLAKAVSYYWPDNS